MNYQEFLLNKTQYSGDAGFRIESPSWLFDFQRDLVEWAGRRGRAAILADCGMGKTPMQLVWADAVVKLTNRPVLIVAPLAASAQTVREAQKFSIDAERNRDGSSPRTCINVTNYERLHLFRPQDYAGMVCDESSILKNFDGVTKAAVTEFMRQMPYRLLCTATAAPNDYNELGTSSEALGELGYIDMLQRFFKNDQNTVKPLIYRTRGEHFSSLEGGKWRFKPHAERPFWRWLCSWARAIRKPSDLGYDDGAFILPALTECVWTVKASRPLDGNLFIMPAESLQEQRAERRATIKERCEAVAAATDNSESFVAWCHLNDEADMIERMIPGAQQVSGADSDDEKEEKFLAFQSGQLRVLVTKPKIGAFGLNWQHCARMSVFPSHSYEQYYQAIRRCWRFGQTKEVIVHVITTEGEADVLGNLQRKAAAADRMFTLMVEEMNSAAALERSPYIQSATTAMPSWILKGA